MHLKDLNLSKNNFDDKGGERLGHSVCKNESIVRINLSDNNFTDVTALAFNHSLQSNKALTEVNLTRNLINLRHLEILQSQLLHNKEFQEREEPRRNMAEKNGMADDCVNAE